MKIRLMILALISFTLLTGCKGDGETETTDGRIQVIATTGQVADLVRNVGGDLVNVRALMGPGIDPHLYKASAGDVERLRSADLIFYNGLHLEAKMGDVIAQIGAHKPVVAVGEALPDDRLLSPSEFKGMHDPHVWFDVALWKLTAGATAEALSKFDPDHTGYYQAKAAAYATELDALDAYAREQFATVPERQRVLVTAHDAFNYLGRAYDLEVRGLQGISTATEAGTGDVQDLAAYIAEREIPALFVETSVSPRAIEAVRQAVRSRGFEVVVGGEIYSDALGDTGTPAGTYIGMVRHNVDTITSALRGKANHE
jgi:manganese/zinc/iron transport system substrate-binding protein